MVSSGFNCEILDTMVVPTNAMFLDKIHPLVIDTQKTTLLISSSDLPNQITIS